MSMSSYDVSLHFQSTLRPASELREIADNAPTVLMRGAVARACNDAALTGERCVEWTGELTPEFKLELESDPYNYKVENKLAPDGVIIPNMWIFNWEGEA